MKTEATYPNPILLPYKSLHVDLLTSINQRITQDERRETPQCTSQRIFDKNQQRASVQSYQTSHNLTTAVSRTRQFGDHAKSLSYPPRTLGTTEQLQFTPRNSHQHTCNIFQIESRPQADPALPFCGHYPTFGPYCGSRPVLTPSKCFQVDPALPISGLSPSKEKYQDTTFNSGQLGIKSRPMLLSYLQGPLNLHDFEPAPSMLYTPALSTLVVPVPLMLDVPAISAAKAPVLLLTPSFITSGPSNPHDPGPSAGLADHTVFSLTHRAFFISTIYALNDFLCIPPRSPSM
jgi:hypothetical protein